MNLCLVEYNFKIDPYFDIPLHAICIYV